jgi:hypothetical protein
VTRHKFSAIGSGFKNIVVVTLKAVLVGDAELARVRAALERALAGSLAAVVVAGEAGVGTTRLVLELGPSRRNRDEPQSPTVRSGLLLRTARWVCGKRHSSSQA